MSQIIGTIKQSDNDIMPHTKASAVYYGQNDSSNVATEIGNLGTSVSQLSTNKANQSALINVERKVDALYKIGEGQIYDIDEVTYPDQTHPLGVYSADVPTGSFVDNVLKIGGKSVVMNQLVQNGDFVDASGWSSNASTFTISNNKANVVSLGSGSGVSLNKSNVNVISGHKYFISITMTPIRDSLTPRIDIYDNTLQIRIARANFILSSTNKVDLQSIIIPNETDNSAALYFYVSSSQGTIQPGDVIVFENAQLFDLTAMFGSGNEPSTVAEFKAMFPKDYYAYGTGSIVSAGTKRVDVVGKNLFDLSVDSQLTYIPITKDMIGNSYSLSCNLQNFMQYKISTTAGGSTTWASSSNPVSVTITQAMVDAGKLFVINNTSYTSFTRAELLACEFQIEKGSTATSYSPYNASQTSIPSAIQSLTGYGWSAGTAYNEVDYSNKKYIQRVSRVDLGSLNWTYNSESSHERMVATAPSNIKRILQSVVANILCEKYIVTSSDLLWLHQKDNSISSYYYSNNGVVWVYSSTMGTDASAFKSSLSGVYLYYELETPVETDISNLLDEGFLEALDVEAGGNITFVSDTESDAYRLPVPNTNEFFTVLQNQ